ncbi:MAG: hypothetical protein J2P57_03280 [Acidimicrobiaceae bacterium]|nr:hypothetical protein [Acidimicrobiaceae bacterium]
MSSHAQTPEQAPTYLFGRLDRHDLLLGLRASQLVMVGIGAAAILVGFLAGGEGGGVLGFAVAAVTGFVAVFPVQGRCLVDWARPLANHALRRVTGRGVYLGGPIALHRSRFAPRLDLPGMARDLRVFEIDTPRGGVALLKLREKWTVVLPVSSPNYVLADRASQERRVASWGALLAQCGQEGSRVAGLQWLERTIPDTGRSLQEWWQQAGDRDAAFAHSYRRLIEQAGPAATRHECYLAVSFDARRLRRLVRQAGGGPEGAAKVALAEIDWISQALRRADLEVAGALSPEKLARLVRTQYDHAAAVLETHGIGPWRQPAIASGPMAAVAEWSRYRTDGDLHAVYWIAEWPSVPVEAAWCYPLLALSGVRRTVSVSAAPIPPSKSLRELRGQRVAKRADEAQRRRLGQIETAQDTEEVAGLERREHELVRGHTEYRFTGWITVSATTADQLDAACALVEQSAVRSALVLRRVYGEVDQAFNRAALPLNEGVR